MWGLILLACTSEIKETEFSFCSSATSALYDPLGSEEILSFPDDFLTSADPHSPTGLYLDFSESKAPWSPLLPNLLLSVPQDAKTRSGFARMGNVVMRFSGPISEGPNDPLASLEDSSLLWLDISVSPPERIPFSTKLGEDFDQLILSPLFPLRPGAKHAVFMTNEYSDAEGNCIAPAPLIKDIINDTATEPLHEMHSDYMEAISAAEINPETISHAIVFTTQADHGLMIEVSHDIEQQSYRWEEEPNCESTEEHRYCVGTLKARDYRNGKEILDTE
ncbi:MAG: hypothetical protein VX278_08165, partial [Myxococcota bacterium]|nr:hypothetical protein [Myxococcota bacterium]